MLVIRKGLMCNGMGFMGIGREMIYVGDVVMMI